MKGHTLLFSTVSFWRSEDFFILLLCSVVFIGDPDFLMGRRRRSIILMKACIMMSSVKLLVVDWLLTLETVTLHKTKPYS